MYSRSLGLAGKLALALCSVVNCLVQAASNGGTIAGNISDQAGAPMANVSVRVRDINTGTQRTALSNHSGYYAFPLLDVGSYEIAVAQSGFWPYRRTGLHIDANVLVQADIRLDVGARQETVSVTDNALPLEYSDTELGETISGRTINATPLNGRSFTDLLALQPGVVPISSQQPNAVNMGGVTTSMAPSGDLNAGNLSISGQRETANGFMVNGSDVEENVNMGTSIVPNVDSIAEFRILTNNFDAEYGNYSGGQVLVVTKSGTNDVHGGAFDYLRNTSFDARNFFSAQRARFQQNQFGGSFGAPIRRNKVFLFVDYQGTHMVQGIDTGLVTVPSPGQSYRQLQRQQ